MIHNITPSTTINDLNHNYKDLEIKYTDIFDGVLFEMLYSHRQIEMILYIYLIYRTYLFLFTVTIVVNAKII